MMRADVDGKLTKPEAEKIVKNLMRKAQQRSKWRKIDIEQSIKEVGMESAEELRKKGQLAVRNRVLNEVRYRQAQAHVDQFPSDFLKGVRSILEEYKGVQKGMGNSVDTMGSALNTATFARLAALVDKAGAGTEFKKGLIDLEIRQELYNLDLEKPLPVNEVSNSPKARAVAEAIREVGEDLRAHLNSEGADIGKLDGFAGRQVHDKGAMLAGGHKNAGFRGKALSEADAKKRWVAFHMDRMDMDRTIREGTEPEDYLSHFWDNVISEDFGTDGVAKGQKGALSSRLNVSRELHYKDAQSAHEAALEYGQPRIFDGLVTDYQSLTRSLAMMKRLGPDPDGTITRLVDTQVKKLKAAGKAKEAGEVGAQVKAHIDRAYAMANGTWQKPENVSISKFGSIVKAIVRMAKLGGAAVTSISDVMFANVALAHRGMGTLKAFTCQFEATLD